MIRTTFNYSTAGEYVHDASKIEFVSGKARLKLINNPGQSFSQAFSDPAGFIYDTGKAEFVGGVCRQKDQRPAGATFGATYTTNMNGSWGGGSLTGTPTGSPSIDGGKLKLTTAGGGDKVTYPAAGNVNGLVQTGCIRFKLTPNFTSAPAADLGYFAISEAANVVNNLIQLTQSNGEANAYLRISTSAGASPVNVPLALGLVSGVECEIEINFNYTTGETRVFKNGVQLGSTLTGTGTRSSNIGYFVIGSSYDGRRSNFWINDFVVFTTVQHTANYTPGYTLPETVYATSAVTCPEMAYTGPGTLISADDLLTTEVGAPHYTLQIGRSGTYLYWNGTAWAISDGSYAQANDAATFLAHIAALPVLGEVYGQFKVHFPDSAVQSSIDILTIDLTAQIYPMNSPAVKGASPVYCDGLDNIEFTGTAEIKFILLKASVRYWWNGTAWAVSDGSYAQANTVAEILAHKAAFTTEKINLYVEALLYSDGDTQTEIDELVLDTSFAAPETETLDKCIVWGYVNNADGTPYVGTLEVWLWRDTKYKTTFMLKKDHVTVNVVDGYFEVDLVESENMEAGSFYVFKIDGRIYKRLVPDVVDANFYELLPPA